MGRVSASVDAILGLRDFKVTRFYETDIEVVFEIETTETKAICERCEIPGRFHERRSTAIRDLFCWGRSTRLIWNKSRFRCENSNCRAKP